MGLLGGGVYWCWVMRGFERMLKGLNVIAYR